MRYEFTQTAVPTEHITQSALQSLGRLQQKRQLDDSAHDDFATVRAMLEAMRLPTDQFGLACRRLQNAQHYLRHTEPGAARYELQLLASSLKNGEPEVREPRRRLRGRTH